MRESSESYSNVGKVCRCPRVMALDRVNVFHFNTRGEAGTVSRAVLSRPSSPSTYSLPSPL